ncbi:Hypothetical predicted protein [Pelobates cultripes]|uniref:Uncharacterized protein n=1 Tax=Pelobates cultripes TaxID=61616 RepID=A0AAD1RYR9_PELCU|nr:Hypothetical predicted protein [Pelobates cultripes]
MADEADFHAPEGLQAWLCAAIADSLPKALAAFHGDTPSPPRNLHSAPLGSDLGDSLRSVDMGSAYDHLMEEGYDALDEYRADTSGAASPGEGILSGQSRYVRETLLDSPLTDHHRAPPTSADDQGEILYPSGCPLFDPRLIKHLCYAELGPLDYWFTPWIRRLE